MLIDHFPLGSLRLTTADLVLCLPTDEQLAALADLAVDGVHDPASMPFSVPWSDGSPGEVGRGVVLHHWRELGGWRPQGWSLPLVVLRDGVVVGKQNIGALDFAVRREVHTGSWLGRRFHGQGIGTQMRAAVLELAFSGLGAQEARSGAFVDNPASYAVSRKLGYVDDGVSRHVVRGALAVQQRVRLTRERWEQFRRVEVAIDGLPSCLSWFGAD